MTRARALLVLLLGVTAVEARPAQRSLFEIPTGNGFGFQVLDARTGRLLAFFDHPYRYLRPLANERVDGLERRNLLEALEFKTMTTPSAARGAAAPEVSYLRETGVLDVRRPDGAREFYFSPFGLHRNAFVAIARGAPGDARELALQFHLGGNPVSKIFWEQEYTVVKLPGERIEALPGGGWVETGMGAGALLYLPLQAGTRAVCENRANGETTAVDDGCAAADLRLIARGLADRFGDFGFLVVHVESAAEIGAALRESRTWLTRRSPTRLIADELAEWESWRRAPPVRLAPEELALWRQSEAVLRMGQVRAPNVSGVRRSQGMILASLAPGSWATGWVRDGTYATVALARAGHFVEARRSLDFFLNAGPVGKYKSYVGGQPYRISLTRYFGSGEEEADYAGHDTPNIETDGWGLYLWAARQYVDRSGDRAWLARKVQGGSVYEVLRAEIAEPIVRQLETDGPWPGIMKADSSIWEVHQENARHFAYSTFAAARGLCDFASLARRAGHSTEARRYAQIAEATRIAALRAFTVPEGHLVGATERSRETDYDGAIVEAFGFDLLRNRKDPLAEATLRHLEELRVPSGGFQRRKGPDAYDTDEWPFINFRMASTYAKLGRRAEATALIARMRSVAALNFNLLPELYNADPGGGDFNHYKGSNPMVGYGAGAYLITMLELGGVFERRDCR